MVDFNRVSIKNKATYLRALKIDGGIEMYGAILEKGADYYTYLYKIF